MDSNGTPKYLLIADDDSDLREVLRNLLSSRIEHIVEARDGLEARKLVDALPIAAVLTDVNMGRNGGLQLVQELRRQGLNIPVVFLSGELNFEERISDPALQPCWFSPKPFSNQELRELVLRVFLLGVQESSTRLELYRERVPQ
jgi:DNA-binding NtrC family response regulator